MTELKINWKKVGFKKVLSLMLVMCLSMTLVGMNVYASDVTTAGQDIVKGVTPDNGQTPSNGQTPDNGNTPAPTPTPTPVVTPSVTLTATSFKLQVGTSTTGLKVKEANVAGDTIAKVTSSDKKVATATLKKGVITITGKKVAKAAVTVTVTMKSGATATAKVTVVKGAVATKSLSLNASKLELLKGKTSALVLTKNPISATDSITWTSSNEKVATVNANGKVTAVAAGKATITAKAANGKKVTCKVTVKNPAVTLTTKKATVKVGSTVAITVKSLYPVKDTVKSFKTSNKKVATVTKAGVVKGVKAGKATITVTTKSGATATFTVTVKKK